ncbi:MAG: hypothetical protein KDD61_04700 [Bdellovibrionales bacterium]|nr:hypothetical protein [Bdellovibrionales bacterium]
MPQKCFSKNQKGQGLIEYLILVAIIAIASIAVTRVLGQQIKRKYTEIAYALSGEQRKLAQPKIDSSIYQKSDLSNFMKGSAAPHSQENSSRD